MDLNAMRVWLETCSHEDAEEAYSYFMNNPEEIPTKALDLLRQHVLTTRLSLR